KLSSPGAENASYPSSKRPSESREKSRVPPAGAYSIAFDDHPLFGTIGNSGTRSPMIKIVPRNPMAGCMTINPPPGQRCLGLYVASGRPHFGGPLRKNGTK